MKGETYKFVEHDSGDYPFVITAGVWVNWSYDPGCWYRRNGDPGDPPSFDYEVVIEYICLVDELGTATPVDPSEFDNYRSAIESEVDKIPMQDFVYG